MGRKANGEGSVYLRKDGRFEAATFVTLPNGERTRIYFTKKRKSEVQELLREAQERERNHIPYNEKKWTVAQYLRYWMDEVQISRIREGTWQHYNNLICKYIIPSLGAHKLEELSPHHIRRALCILEESGTSDRVRQGFLQVLSACLGCAMREELVFRNVAILVEKPKYTPKETAIWSTEEAMHFLRTAEGHQQYVAFLLFLTYGMRRGEVLALRYSDVDFSGGVIHVRQQIDRLNGKIKARELKTANSRRDLPLTDDVRAAILQHAEKNGVSALVYNPHHELSTGGTIIVSEAGTPLEPRNLARCFNILIKKAGLPRIKIHAMRHMAATALKDLDVPIKDTQLILGHANIATTMNIYQHGTPTIQRTALGKISSRLAGAS